MDSPALPQNYNTQSSTSKILTEATNELGRIGLASWFNLDFRHVAKLMHKASITEQKSSLSPRLQFLQESLQDNPSLEVYERLYATFLLLDDYDASYACTGAAISSIWTSGKDFSRYDLWLSRTNFLLKQSTKASPLAVASLLSYKTLVELTGHGNLSLSAIPYTEQRYWAEKSDSVSLRLLHASTAAFCSFWAGDLTAAELLLTETLPLSKMANSSLLATLLYNSCLGLCKMIKGDINHGVALLEEVVGHKAFSLMPLSVYLHLYTTYLYVLCLSDDLAKIEKVSNLIMLKTIPPCNYYHLACLHLCLGIAALRMGKPRKALLHTEIAQQRGNISGSPLIQPIAALIHSQALADLHEDAQALNHLSTWLPRWQKKGFALFAATGALEMTAIYLSHNKFEMAVRYLEIAQKNLPRGEQLIPLFRNEEFIQQIRISVKRGEKPSCPVTTVEKKSVVNIQTLGNFCLTINYQQLYDREWKGRRLKQLLKAIIALGGTKVPLEKLSRLCWPDSDGDNALNNLKMALSRLRRVGGNDCSSPVNWLVVKHRRVSLVQSICKIDAWEFSRAMKRIANSKNEISLQRTLALYKNDFLPNDEDPWICNYRNHLRKLFIEGVLRLAPLKKTEDAVLLTFLEQARHSDPLHEGIYACLMEHYINTGCPAHALNVFNKAEKVISTQTGLQPGVSLQALALLAKKSQPYHQA
jgi:DNA-binding SARP family transcriptional activator